MIKAYKISDPKEREPSPARCDGYIRIAARVLLDALKDLTNQDLVKRYDALLWFASSPICQLYLDATGLGVDPIEWLCHDGWTEEMATNEKSISHFHRGSKK